MKPWKVILASIVTGVLFSLVGCGDDDNGGNITVQPQFQAADMHSGSTKVWKTVSSTWQYNPDGSIPITGTDDLLIINSDGTAMKVWGEIPKPGETAKVDAYNWTLSGDTLTFTGVEGTPGAMEAKIVSMSPQVLVYDLKLDVPNVGSFAVRNVSVPMVFPNTNASAENKLLTGGSSKLWKITAKTRDGVALPLESWQQDDMWLYNTDGTGFFLRGEQQETPGAPSSNDAFLWQFTDNRTKIDTEFSENPNDVFDSTIIELTSDRFVYEAIINGSVIRVTAMPVVRKL